MAETLPEGTDRIIDGNVDIGSGADGLEAGSGSRGGRLDTADLRDRAQSKVEELRGQAGDKARDYAEQGRDRATGALDEVARLIADNAAQLDGSIGETYGDYARRAADYVSGAADTLRDKDVDELLDDARDLIRRAPAVAIGAGAALGFALARVIKAGSETLEASAHAYEPRKTDA